MPNLKLLNNWTSDQLYEFVQRVLDICCDQDLHDFNEMNFEASMIVDRKFAGQHSIDKITLLDIFDYFINLFCNNIDEESILKQLNNNLDARLYEKLESIFKECLKIRKLELFKAIVNRAIQQKYATLENFDWNLIHVISNDQISYLGTTILKLTLFIRASNDKWLTDGTKIFEFEFEKEELIDFIKFLEKAQKDLDDQLKPDQLIS